MSQENNLETLLEKKEENSSAPLTAFDIEKQSLEALIKKLEQCPEQDVDTLTELENAYRSLSTLYTGAGREYLGRMYRISGDEMEDLVNALRLERERGERERFFHAFTPAPVLDPHKIVEMDNELLEGVFNGNNVALAGASADGVMGLYFGLASAGYAACIACFQKLKVFTYSKCHSQVQDMQRIATVFMQLGHAYVNMVSESVQAEIASGSVLDIHHLKTAVRCVLEVNRLMVFFEDREALQVFQERRSALQKRIHPNIFAMVLQELQGAGHPRFLREEKENILVHLTFLSAWSNAFKMQEAYLKEWVELLLVCLPGQDTARFLKLEKAYSQLSDLYLKMGKFEEAEAYNQKKQHLAFLQMSEINQIREEEAAQRAAESAERKEEEDCIAALVQAAPEEEQEALQHIYAQEQREINLKENTHLLIDCYEKLPKRYAQHISYLQQLQDLKKQEPQEYEWDSEERMLPRCQMIQVLIDLGEVYLRQYEAERRKSALGLASRCFKRAQSFFQGMRRSLGRHVLVYGAGPKKALSVYHYLPLCMEAMIADLGRRLISNGMKEDEDAAAHEVQQTVSDLTQKIYRLGQSKDYASQVTELMNLNLIVTGAQDFACAAQTALLLSEAYCHLEELKLAEQYLQIAVETIATLDRSGVRYNQLLFAGMQKTSAERFEKAWIKKAQPLVAQVIESSSSQGEGDRGRASQEMANIVMQTLFGRSEQIEREERGQLARNACP